jgi:hypothetical protein
MKIITLPIQIIVSKVFYYGVLHLILIVMRIKL